MAPSQSILCCNFNLNRHPDLILQLSIPDSTSIEYQFITRQIHPASFVCFLSLIDEDTNDDKNTVRKSEENKNPKLNIDPEIPYQNFIGQRISTGILLVDPVDNKQRIFFIFPDLAIRTTGEYKLQIDLINMDRYFSIHTSQSCVFTTITNGFDVYSSRKFPGVDQPTPLVRSFMAQGISELGRRQQ